MTMFSGSRETVPDTSDIFYGIKWANTGTNKEYLVFGDLQRKDSLQCNPHFVDKLFLEAGDSTDGESAYEMDIA